MVSTWREGRRVDRERKIKLEEGGVRKSRDDFASAEDGVSDPFSLADTGTRNLYMIAGGMMYGIGVVTMLVVLE